MTAPKPQATPPTAFHPAPTIAGGVPRNRAPSALSGPAIALPPFDPAGNLNPGPIDAAGGAQNHIHFTTLADIKGELVDAMPTSNSRAEIFEGWMRHRTDVESLGLDYTTLVDGSFCSRKLNPGDVDLCYLFDPVSVNNIAAADKAKFRSLFDLNACKPQYRVDPYFMLYYPMGHLRLQDTLRNLAYWIGVFGSDRKDNPKAILMVGERGVL